MHMFCNVCMTSLVFAAHATTHGMMWHDSHCADKLGSMIHVHDVE